MNEQQRAEALVGRMRWFGHDGFRIEGHPTIYLDPWKLEGDHPPADLLLITHDHFDHCSLEDIARVKGPDTVVMGPAAVAEQVPGARTVEREHSLKVAGVGIHVVPAYNIDKFKAPGEPFHPEGAGHVGYVLTIDGVRVYFAGDTDLIPEMSTISCDVAMLPVSGTYVMTVEEAVQAAEQLKPRVVVPMHYGLDIGSPDDGKRFAGLYSGRSIVLERQT